MDLMSQLQSEQHIARELANRLSQQEDELKEIRDQVSLGNMAAMRPYDLTVCCYCIKLQKYTYPTKKHHSL